MKQIFFDLDGTLTDPGVGITNSVMHALKTYGIVEEDREKLYPFIGPPLPDSFQQYYGFSKEKSLEAVDRFREYFSVKGLFENEIYPGIPHLLARLKEEGKKIHLATSKPEVFAKKILEHFKIDSYFTVICGASLDESKHSEKTAILKDALSRSGADPRESIMVGDRKYDILGGRAYGMKTVGVLYGYGSREELSEAGAHFVAENVDELEKELLK